jgi:hypothetical protein
VIKRLKDQLDYSVHLHYSENARYPYRISICCKIFKDDNPDDIVDFKFIQDKTLDKAKTRGIQQFKKDGYCTVSLANADPNFDFNYETGDIDWH